MIADSSILRFENREVRMLVQDSEPWWVAKDVCAVLGIRNHRQALTRLDEDEKGVIQNDTLGGKQKMAVVNEPGLYHLIDSSDKPEAKAFKRWIRHEVLPSIRKTGIYVAPNPDDSTLFAGAMQIVTRMNEMQDRLTVLEAARQSAESEITELPQPCGVLPGLSQADDLHRAVRLYCRVTGTAKGKFMETIYNDFRDYFGINVIQRKRNRGWRGSTLTFAIHEGYGDRLYALVFARLIQHVKPNAA